MTNATGPVPGLSTLAGIPLSDAMLDAKLLLDAAMRRRAGAGLRVNAQALDASSNIQGSSVGLGTGAEGVPPGEPVLTVYLAEPAPLPELRSTVAESLGVRAAGFEAEVPLRGMVTGFIDAQANRFRLRPAACGMSTGHINVSAGTLGALVVGRTAPRNERLMILSNNHVLADCNAGRVGDPIVQPGTYEGGRAPADTVATLEAFVELHFDGTVNLTDCATAWAWPDRVRADFVQLAQGVPTFFRASGAVLGASLGLGVGKSGRTTQITRGEVTALGVSVWVNYPGGRSAYFEDQIGIQAHPGNFSEGGDSGSMVWTWDAQRRPVGLLFAGGNGVSFATPLQTVLDALDVDLYLQGA